MSLKKEHKQMNSKKALQLYQRGQNAQEKQQFAQALRFYKAALEIDTKFRPALVSLGFIYSQLGQSSLAMGFFHQAYALTVDAPICFNLGSECFKQKDLEKARSYLKECLGQDKRMLKAHLLLAYLYQKTKKHDKAAIYFQNALKLSPMNRMAILGYAAALSEQGHYETALYAVQRYLNKVKSDLFAQELRAHLLLELGRSEEAYSDYVKLVKSSPKFTKFSEHLKKIHQEAGEEYKQTFINIDAKINKRLERIRKRLEGHKAIQGRDLSAQRNGIEGSQDLEEELKENSRDMLDLSLLHLFKGNSAKAMKYLFQAHKWKK